MARGRALSGDAVQLRSLSQSQMARTEVCVSSDLGTEVGRRSLCQRAEAGQAATTGLYQDLVLVSPVKAKRRGGGDRVPTGDQ